MKKILVFGGTTEGRAVAEILSENNVETDVCVATEYGEMVLEEMACVRVKQGRLDAGDIAELVGSGEYCAVIDATHPFAVEVSANIRQGVCSAGAKIPLIRFERNTKLGVKLDDNGSVVYFDDASSCAEALEKALERIEGKILLTTGSKELGAFCRSDALRKKLVVRVLPGLESVRLCYDAGLEGKQIIAMQGPFSEQMNRAVINEYGISVLVTKESGKTGGVDEKLSAAKNAGIKCFVIRRPQAGTDACSCQNSTSQKPVADEVISVSTIDELCRALETRLSLHLDAKTRLTVTLAGIGMGSPDTMTQAVRACISKADCVFGAPRMLESAGITGAGLTSANCAGFTCASYPYYLADDIIPVLRKMLENPPHGKVGTMRAVVLFSGDPGFYSGAEKLKTALASLPNTDVQVLPGISSVQYLAAKLGLSWQNAAIISMHGVSEYEWLPALESYVKSGRTVFFLTSGAEDIRRIGSALVSFRQFLREASTMLEYTVYAGFRLSYPDEKILSLTPEECADAAGSGLCSGFLVPVQMGVK
ncbi:MAG: precorrin-6A reductase [Spirochaetaceae bacterium]|nr:precorrin-6A reductase [Spirochaetaceae bacterium]